MDQFDGIFRVPLLGVPGITLDQWLGSWVISPTYTWGTPWGCNPLSLTFDPNFLEHPSKEKVFQPSIFRGELALSFREGILTQQK